MESQYSTKKIPSTEMELTLYNIWNCYTWSGSLNLNLGGSWWWSLTCWWCLMLRRVCHSWPGQSPLLALCKVNMYCIVLLCNADCIVLLSVLYCIVMHRQRSNGSAVSACLCLPIVCLDAVLSSKLVSLEPTCSQSYVQRNETRKSVFLHLFPLDPSTESIHYPP